MTTADAMGISTITFDTKASCVLTDAEAIRADEYFIQINDGSKVSFRLIFSSRRINCFVIDE